MNHPPHDHHHPEDEEGTYEERVEKLMTMTVAGAKGIVPPGQVMLPLMQIAQGNLAPPEIKAYTRVLLQILKGSRDPSLGADLPPDLAEAVAQTLVLIDEPIPQSEEESRQELTLTDLLERVGEACLGNVSLWQDLWKFMDELIDSPATPPHIKNLAVVLKKILAGERQSHITESLSPELQPHVTLLLEQLALHSAPTPPEG